MASKFVVRDAMESDFPFIYSTWLKGLRYGNKTYEKMDKDSYFKNYHRIIGNILSRPDAYILVACLNDDPTTILGYSVREGENILHYIHVKNAFRRFGIGRALSPGKITKVTHVTDVGWAILCEKYPNAVYDPFLN